ncbi:methyltransferase family protein [Parasulfitobacter algicola]|uniref:Isoprenylcysteine carboxylmethyltransferase family protein n=1 Tax=Parasulfitobacter algicola TaxID=2614809 RepID=A0ABX2J104_9RHOB|nr:isoprenylcysteine carboxylmethyltransferase family protein [Sulfitobacter algicola]NSX56483.1 isoprenylcysteine carboxylmethyltransferase family protein [Sulfitobacter algicola]
MTKLIDTPPAWLATCLIIAWLQSHYFDLGMSLDYGITDLLSAILLGGGIIIFFMAVIQFRRHQTTIIPHQEASNLITQGIYKWSRNPIYVADTLILAGLILRWDAVLSLPLIPIFVWIIERRFVIPEENRLRRKFRADFARYEKKTRRWV